MKKLLFAILLLFAFNAEAADKTIHELTALSETPRTTDEVSLWDLSTSTTKRNQIQHLLPVLDVDSYGGLEAAITAIGATEQTVIISSAQTLTANRELVATLEVLIVGGGSINLNTHNLTISGPFDAGNYEAFTGTGDIAVNGPFKAGLCKVFSNTGTMTFGANSVSVLHPEWWGGGTDATAANNVTAFTAAFVPELPIVLQKGVYNFNNNLTITDVPIIKGVPSLTVLTPSAAVTGTFITVETTNKAATGYPYMSKLEGISIDGTATTDVTGLKLGATLAADVFVDNIEIYGFKVGIHVSEAVNCEISNSIFSVNGTNLVGGTGSFVPTTTYFNGCAFLYSSATVGTGVGVYITQGLSVFFNRCIFESNDKEAIKIVVSSNIDVTMGIEHCWFESNQTSEGTPLNFYSITADGSGGAPNGGIDIRIRNCSTATSPKILSFKTIRWFDVGAFYTESGLPGNMFDFESTCYGRLSLMIHRTDYEANVSDDGSNTIDVEDNMYTEPLEVDGATPSIALGNVFKTANTGATTITRFLGGYATKKFYVYFGDSDTTIDFDAATWLRGNGGVDWNPDTKDWMECIQIDDGVGLRAFCDIHEP